MAGFDPFGMISGIFGGGSKAPAPKPISYTKMKPLNNVPNLTSFGGLAPTIEKDPNSDLTSQISALMAKINAQPKLPTFDILGNYSRSKAQATANVTPLYATKMQQFLDRQATDTTNRRAASDLGFQNNAISQTNALEDNSTSRTRTGEDLMAALQMIGTNRQQFLQDDGNQFDVARRGLQESVAAAGGSDTGLGSQSIDTQLKDRNTNSGRQLTTLSQQEDAKNIAATRSLADLATSDTRAGQQKTQADAGVQLDLDSYLNQLPGLTEEFTLNNNLAKASDIANQTRDISAQNVNQFLASLAASGRSGGDIALAKQVYG